MTLVIVSVFKSLPPSQIVPVLVDEGVYLGSESTFYRVMHKRGQQQHRGRAAKPARRKPTSYCATGPNQVWSWDITFLRSPVRGQFFYLYLVIDIYSRMIVTWEVHENESAEHASKMITKACLRHGISALEEAVGLTFRQWQCHEGRYHAVYLAEPWCSQLLQSAESQ